MVITRIEAKIERLPLANPVRIAGRIISSRDWLVVRVTTEDGYRGYGFAFGGYQGGDALARLIKTDLGPLLFGAVLHGRPALPAAILDSVLGKGQKDAVRAISAIEIACWDLMARRACKSLADFIGRVPTTGQSTYVGSGYYLGDVETDAKAVAAVAAKGAPAIKVKVGGAELDTDLARVSAFRQAIGPKVDLIVDANGAWKSLSMAARAVQTLQPLNILYFEDPLPPDRLADYRALRISTGARISAGETYASVDDFERALDAEALDIAQVDATACGGIKAFLDIAELCSKAGVPVETHWFPELHSQLALTTPTCRRVEMFLDDEIVNFRKLVCEQANVHAGHGVDLAYLFANPAAFHPSLTNEAEKS